MSERTSTKGIMWLLDQVFEALPEIKAGKYEIMIGRPYSYDAAMLLREFSEVDYNELAEGLRDAPWRAESRTESSAEVKASETEEKFSESSSEVGTDEGDEDYRESSAVVEANEGEENPEECSTVVETNEGEESPAESSAEVDAKEGDENSTELSPGVEADQGPGEGRGGENAERVNVQGWMKSIETATTVQGRYLTSES